MYLLLFIFSQMWCWMILFTGVGERAKLGLRLMLRSVGTLYNFPLVHGYW